MKNKESMKLKKNHFDELEEELKLKKFNLVVGKNKVGKTLLLSSIRNKYVIEHDSSKDYNNIIKRYSLKDTIKYVLDKKFSNYFIDLIKLIDNEIIDLYLEYYDNCYILKAVYKNHIEEIEVNSAISDLFKTVHNLIYCRNGVAVIDDFCIKVHYSLYKEIFKKIFTICNDFDIRLCISTFSTDVFNGFIDALMELDEKDSQVIRLDKKEEKINPVCFNLDELIISKKNNIDIF